MSQPLFRPEVIDAQTAQYLGSIRIGHKLGDTTIAVIAAALAVALVAFAILGDATRKERIAGLVVPAAGTLDLRTAATGTVLHIQVAEGTRVQAGDVLFVVGTDRSGAQGDIGALVASSLKQRQDTLRAERQLLELQARQRLQSIDDRLRALVLEASQAAGEVEFAQTRVSLAQRSVERYRRLAADGFVSDVQAQQQQEELIDLQTRLQSAQRTVAVLEREQQSLRNERAASHTQLQADIARLERALVGVSQEVLENDGRRQAVIRAPQAGVVTTVHVTPGSAVQAAQSLGTLVPESAATGTAALRAELYAPSRTAGFVQPGQTVWLRYSAFPYQKFGMFAGAVASVSRTPVNPQDLPPGMAQALLQAAGANEPLYRVVVSLKQTQIEAFGESYAVRAGMTLDADVVQEERAIWEWIFEPLLAARQRWTGPRAGAGGA